MFQLNNLAPLVKKRKRVGRGGSRGGTSGKGSKGQNARSGGGVGILFEGGQMPLHRRLPKRGFNNYNFKKVYEIVSIGDLDRVFSEGDAITREALIGKGLIKGARGAMVKVLGDGQLSKKVVITVDACSQSALQAIQSAGGKVQLIKES